MSSVLNIPRDSTMLRMARAVEAIATATADFVPADRTWDDIKQIVQKGMGPKLFPVGTIFTVNHSVYGNHLWMVLGHNCFKRADGSTAYTMTICAVPVLTSLQFDAPEAFYYADAALTAGTYNVILSSAYGAWAAGTYQFTLTQALPQGGQLRINGYESTAITSLQVQAFASRTATSATESVAITAGSSGTNLGTFGNGAINHIQRVSYGSNNYKESALRQFLNSAAPAGSVWTPQTKFDRPPSWASSTAGFMAGLDPEFVDAVCFSEIPCATNATYEAPDSTTTVNSKYSVYDKFFLLSCAEIGFGQTDVNDGTSVLPYYDGAANTDRIKYNTSGSAPYRWLRTPSSWNAIHVRLVHPDGSLDGYGARGTYGLAPACNIG